MTSGVSIVIEDIRLRGRCGVTAEERLVGQLLAVDVRLEPAACPGTITDDLDGTVDYGHVVRLVRGIVEGGEYKLLERLATVIADALWGEFELAALSVAVAKTAPPVVIPVAAARVEVERKR